MKPNILRFVLTVILCLMPLSGTTASAAQFKPLTKSQKNLPVMDARITSYQGDVIFVRGGFGVFSKGLDAMAAVLTKQGVKVRVVRNAEVLKTYQRIANNQIRFGRKPVILVGHSWGADAAIQIATYLQKHRIRVNYLATFAATSPMPIPRNVRKVTNYYFKSNGWGRAVQRGKGMSGRLQNIDLSTKKGIHHFNVEKKPRLQRQVIRNILRIIRPKKRT